VSDSAFYLFYYWNAVKECDKQTKLVTGLFERLFQSYDLMAKTILELGTVKKFTITSTKEIIEGWRNKTLNALEKSSKHNFAVSKSFYDRYIKVMLAIIFINHIPNAPPMRIAISTGKLLSLPFFNLKVNIGTYRKEVKKLKEEIDLIKQNP
jgi:hypothetical protein